jgi:hypothetical protein
MSESPKRVLQAMVGQWTAKPNQEVLQSAGHRYVPAGLHGRSNGQQKAATDQGAETLTALVDEGRYDNEMNLGDAFLQLNFEGSLQGRPFRSVGYLGLDAASNEFVEFWADSLGNVHFISTPTFEVRGDSIRLEHQFRHPFTGQVSQLTAEYTAGRESYVHRMTMVEPNGNKTIIKETSFSKR